MGELERRMASPPATKADIEGLPALFGRLGDDVLRLLDTKLSLVKVEVKEDVAVYARNGALMAFGAVLAVVGLVLVNVAIAFCVSLLFPSDEAGAVQQRYGPGSYGWGFFITGLAYLIVGGVIAYVGKRRLAAFNPVPDRTVEELRKDKQWLKNEM